MRDPRWLAVFFGIGLNCDSPILEALLLTGLSTGRGDEIWRKLIEIGFNEATPSRELNEILQQYNWIQRPSPSKTKIFLESNTCPQNNIIIQLYDHCKRYVEMFIAEDALQYSVALCVLNEPFANFAVMVQYDTNGHYKQEKKLWRIVNPNHDIPRHLFYMHSLSRFLNGQSTQIHSPTEGSNNMDECFGIFPKPTFIKC